MSGFLRVGKIVNTHGLKGEMKVISLTEDPRRFDELEYVTIDGEERKILSCKYQKDRIIVRIEGVDTIEEAETYKTKIIEIPREKAIELEEDCYFIADLVQCFVYDTNGKELGKIDEVIQTKSNDVYWIKSPKELLIPVILDVVLDIDINNKKITIKPVGEWQDED